MATMLNQHVTTASAETREQPVADSAGSPRAVTPKKEAEVKNLWLPVPSIKLSNLPDLAQLAKFGNKPCRPEGSPGSGTRVRVNDDEVALFRFGNRVFATSAICPHAGGPLELGDIEDLAVNDPCVVCPYHKYKFRILSGRNCMPNQRLFDVETYPVQVKKSGRLFIGFAKLPDHVFGDDDF